MFFQRISSYLLAEPLLTIDPNQRLQTKVKELETIQADQLAAQGKELQQLKQEIEIMKQWTHGTLKRVSNYVMESGVSNKNRTSLAKAIDDLSDYALEDS